MKLPGFRCKVLTLSYAVHSHRCIMIKDRLQNRENSLNHLDKISSSSLALTISSRCSLSADSSTRARNFPSFFFSNTAGRSNSAWNKKRNTVSFPSQNETEHVQFRQHPAPSKEHQQTRVSRGTENKLRSCPHQQLTEAYVLPWLQLRLCSARFEEKIGWPSRFCSLHES